MGTISLDVADIANVAGYGLSLTSHPSAGIDALGNIYLGYSSLMEGEAFINLEDNQHYATYISPCFPDGGATWKRHTILSMRIFLRNPISLRFRRRLSSFGRDVGNTIELIYQERFPSGFYPFRRHGSALRPEQFHQFRQRSVRRFSSFYCTARPTRHGVS